MKKNIESATFNNMPKKREYSAYSLGMLGQSIIYGLGSVGIGYYFQSVIFLPALAIGLINVAVQAFSIIKESIMGVIVDKTSSKRGKCRPYLLIMPSIILVFTVLLYINGIYEKGNSLSLNAGIIAWAAVSYLLWSLVFTIGDVPMNSFPSVMTGCEKKRSKVFAVSRIAAMLGAGGVSLFYVPLSQSASKIFNTGIAAKNTQLGFITVMVMLAFVGALLFQITGLFSKERIKQKIVHKPSAKASFSAMWKCKPYRYLFISGILRAPASTMFVVLVTFIVYYFGDNGNSPYVAYMLIFQLSAAAGQVVSTLFTPKLSEKFDRKKLVIITNLIAVVPCAALLLLFLFNPHGLNSPPAVAGMTVAFFAIGGFVGVLNTIQPIMVADTVDFAEYTTGNRPDGAFFSGQTVVSKIDEGICALLISLVFAIVGFSGDGVRFVNDALNAGASFRTDYAFASYRTAIFILLTVPMMIGFIVSILPLLKYKLTNAEHDRILIELEKKREENSDGPEISDIEEADEIAVSKVAKSDTEQTNDSL